MSFEGFWLKRAAIYCEIGSGPAASDGEPEQAPGPLLWLSASGGLTLHDRHGRQLQLHVPALEGIAKSELNLTWMRIVSEFNLAAPIPFMVVRWLTEAAASEGRREVHGAEVVLATARVQRLAEGGREAALHNDHNAALRRYLLAAEWMEWVGITWAKV